MLVLMLLLEIAGLTYADEGWKPVIRDEFIDHNLDSVPLEIKTNSTVGSYEHLWLNIRAGLNEDQPGFRIKFSSPPEYSLGVCRSWTNFTTPLPTATKKIWRFALDKSRGITVKIHCNGVEMLNLLLSNEACISNPRSWFDIWKKGVPKIRFHPDETASKEYRPFRGTKISVDSSGNEVKGRKPDLLQYKYNATTSWKPVTPGLDIEYDLENSPLEIRINSFLGSNMIISLEFYSALNLNAGGIKIKFSCLPQYQLHSCSQWTNFTDTLPCTITEKIWRIKLDKSSGIRVHVTSDEMPVVDVLVSHQTCNKTAEFDSWSRKVTNIRFHIKDEASDYYRTYKEDLSYQGGWISVKRRFHITHDMENVPLEIITDSRVGCGDKLYLFFDTPQERGDSGFWINFSCPPRYRLVDCSRWTNFPETLPSRPEKIWRITLDKTSGIRLQVHCNEQSVLNITLSDEVCDHSYYRSFWRKHWSGNVTEIHFDPYDTASDYYRPYTNRVDCGWSKWANWSECSAECGEGTQTRYRTGNNPAPVNGGADCEGDAEETQICNRDPCPIDCEWSDFGDWSKCSTVFGEGNQTRWRNRTCSYPVPADGGADCEGDTEESQACNMTSTYPCPAHGGEDCEGDAEETRACNPDDSCPDGTPANWIPVTHLLKIVYDLEKFPLEIKTNSKLGSREFLALRFFEYTPLNNYPDRYEMFYSGGFEILFSSTPQYYIQLCTYPWLDFLTTLPSAAEKIWKITLDKSSGIRIKVHCNEVLVVDFSVSRQNCSYSNWRTWWMNDVTDIWFLTDTKETCYKHCQGQPYNIWDLGGPRKNTTVYGDWGDWSACSVNCGEGTQNRTRTCINTASYSVLCDGETTQTQQCHLNDCPEFSLVDFNGDAVGARVRGLLLNNGGTVCDDDFSTNSADAICHKMGYLGMMSYSSGSEWPIQSGLNITLDDVACSSGEWESCSFEFSHNCNHNEDIFLQCSGPG